MERNRFTPAEQNFYDSVAQSVLIKFNAYLKAGTVMQNYACVLVLLLRLRQACNHPYLINDARLIADEQGPRILDVANTPLVHVFGGNVVVAKPHIPFTEEEEIMFKRLTNEGLKLLASKIGKPLECPICFDLPGER